MVALMERLEGDGQLVQKQAFVLHQLELDISQHDLGGADVPLASFALGLSVVDQEGIPPQTNLRKRVVLECPRSWTLWSNLTTKLWLTQRRWSMVQARHLFGYSATKLFISVCYENLWAET